MMTVLNGMPVVGKCRKCGRTFLTGPKTKAAKRLWRDRYNSDGKECGGKWSDIKSDKTSSIGSGTGEGEK